MQIFNRVKLIFNIEADRIKKRGLLNTLIGCGLLCLIYTLIPRLVKQVWPEHIENPQNFYLFYVTLAIILGTVTSMIAYFPGYFGYFPSFYEKYRINKEISWPWERSDWPQVRKRWAKTLAINKLIINPLYLFTLTKMFGFKYDYSRQTIPEGWQLFKTVIIVMLIDDFLYMVIHRLFHEVKYLYGFHKVHHEYDAPFCLIGEFAHPVEQVFANIMPATFTFAIMKSHMFVLLFWITYKAIISAEGHCGYEFPWSYARVMPFVYGPSYHDFHHSKNVGNYATALYIFETLAGTNHEFFKYEAKQKKLDNHLKAQ